VLLITAAIQICDLKLVHKAVQFSCYFRLHDIQKRFYTLLYDSEQAKKSIAMAKALNPQTVEAIISTCPYSAEEEALLKAIPSVSFLLATDISCNAVSFFSSFVLFFFRILTRLKKSF